ncbi:hypothetical protein GCM10011581_08780 [Saccharopolyspora subtropica]|uniref:Uncharacterized protein n=1 Tax=Saccharopolyspora thermophila TaxID=89367 RepID=A0A917JKZ9_9PSEU|nr:hypothetical protein [Saccharopolyspora subtropica]GGI74049.1 hypothetical protein GCM10011581_08780 [Saccharopolyspora subtropica]
MAHRAAEPVTAGLSRLAQLDRCERARIIRQLCHQYPAFRALLKQVTIARGVAFASGLMLALAVMVLVHGGSVWWVSGMVFAGLAGFCYVAVALTDSRFDLLLAVLGAHRTDELHARLVTEQIYGDDPTPDPLERPVVTSRAVSSRLTGEKHSPVHADR